MSIIKIASSQLGIKEIVGSEDNPQIVSYAQETGISGINNDEIPWCSTFINWCAMKADLPYSGKPNARSWINVGVSTQQPTPGDIVVFWRGNINSWKGHVGLFLGFNHNLSKVYCLGGNQSNEVNITEYDVNKVLSFRKLNQKNIIQIPTPTLKISDKGSEVFLLQKTLTQLGYDCGDIDGVFGPKTESALKLFQANNFLNTDGIYGNNSKNTFTSLLQS